MQKPGVSVTLLFHATEPPLGPSWVPLLRGASCHRAEPTQDTSVQGHGRRDSHPAPHRGGELLQQLP